MLRFRRIVALVLLLLWGPVTVHCGLEMDGLFGLMPPHSAKAGSPAPVSDDTDPDGCGAIENGQFESPLLWVAVDLPADHGCIVWLDMAAPGIDPLPAVPACASFPPLELTPTWVFQRRAASPPRAPALLS